MSGTGWCRERRHALFAAAAVSRELDGVQCVCSINNITGSLSELASLPLLTAINVEVQALACGACWTLLSPHSRRLTALLAQSNSFSSSLSPWLSTLNEVEYINMGYNKVRQRSP